MKLEISENAKHKILDLIVENPNGAVVIDFSPGGCGDLTSKLFLSKSLPHCKISANKERLYYIDDKFYVSKFQINNKDVILVNKNFTNVIDNIELDFVSTITSKSFVVNIPNAKYKCGCGQSFSVGLDGVDNKTNN